MEKELYFEELKTFGACFLNSNELDMTKATENLKVVNKSLKENPELIKQLSNPENLKILSSVGEILQSKGNMMSKIPKVMAAFKKAKF